MRRCVLLLALALSVGCSTPRKPYASDPMLQQRVAASPKRPASAAMTLPAEEPATPKPPRPLAHPTAVATAQLKKETAEPPLHQPDSVLIPPAELPFVAGPELRLPTAPVVQVPPPPLPTTSMKLPSPIEPVIEEKVTPAPAEVSEVVHRAAPRPEPGLPPTKVEGDFGHGAGYIWLQGKLDRHYRGHLNLRYCDASAEDYWGGKVRLGEEGIPGLTDGDVVYVEGEMIPAKGEGSTEMRDGYPTYRVSKVWLVKKASE